MLKNTVEFETVVEGGVLIHPSSVNLEAVTEKLAAKPDLLARTFVVLEGGLYKLVIPDESEEEESLTVLTLSEKDLTNARGLEAKLERAAQAVGYDGEAAKAVVAIATKLMSEAYMRNKKAAEAMPNSGPFSAGMVKREKAGGFIESAQMVMVRPFNVLSERGRHAAMGISNEYWEGLVLEAMAQNDEKRMSYLARQAARALETTGAMGIEGNWRQLYERSMELEVGAGNYPSLNTKQGLTAFMDKVYFPVLKTLLSGAEIASTMGDHEAVMTTAALKAVMEAELAEQTANAAERVQPAKARTEKARIEAEAEVAEVLEKNGDVLKEGKRVSAQLAAATVASPLMTGTGQVLEAASEALPAMMKGHAQAWNRWLEQIGVDPKLVAWTAIGGGSGIPLTVACVVAFGPWGLLALPATPFFASMIYTGIKGLKK